MALSQNSMRFTEVVNKVTVGSPMPFLSSHEKAGRGCFRSMVSIDGIVNLLLTAAVWVDRERRYFLSPIGTDTLGDVLRRSRYHMVGTTAKLAETANEIPNICEGYYKFCSRIDRQNSCRQDHLDLEKNF